MNFTKLKLLGYYRTEKQTMRPEEFRIDEAKDLSIKLNSSFANVTDTDLLAIVDSNAVMIFRDSQHKLYAYFPSQKIARVTEVVYNPQSINKPLQKLAMWFVPGEPLVIGSSNATKVQKNITFSDIDHNWKEYNDCDVRLTTHGGDFLIYLDKTCYAIDWGDEYISVSGLRSLINHKWTFLYEYDLKLGCEECDGYSYSNCDFDRCKHNCEKCGGRRYICNNSCFNYRNDRAVRIGTSKKLATDLDQAAAIIDKICAQFAQGADYMEQQYDDMFKSLMNDCDFVNEYLEDSDIEKFQERFSQMKLLNKCRQRICSDTQKVHITVDSKSYTLLRDDVKIVIDGWIWKDYYIVANNAYDYISDSLVSIKQEWKFKDKIYRNDFITSVERCNVSEISIYKDALNFKK